jgi:flagellar M-ring protein FliF
MAQNKFVEQITAFFKRLTTTQKVVLGVSVVAAIAGLSMLVFQTSKPTMSVLFSDLEQKDAAVIVDKLKEQNIPYEIGSNGTSVLVTSDKVYETRLALAKDGFMPNNTVGYEIFDKTNLGMSDFVQKLNYKRAIEGELQKTIASFDECQKVRVMIVMPERTLFEKDQKKPTAAVHLHLKNGRSISKLNVEGIQNLVASSIEGMAPQDVTVVDQRGQILSEAKKEANSLAGMSSTQMEQQQKVDEYMIKRVQSLLDGVLGPNKAIVRVNTDLDFTQLERTREQFDPDGQVVLSEEKINESHSGKDTIDIPAVSNQSSVGKVRSNYLNSKVIERLVNAVGTIKRVSVSVMVDGITKVQETNGEKKLVYTPRTDDEIQKITQIVRNAVGFDPQRNDQISVVNMAFDQTALEEDLKEQPSAIDMTPKEMIDVGLIALAMIIAIWMVRKLFASKQLQRRIEEIISPPVQQIADRTASMIQLNAPPGSEYTVSPDGKLMIGASQQPAGYLQENRTMSEKDLLAKARARLDERSQSSLSEDQLIVEEMKHRLQRFFDSNEADAMKMVKAVMTKTNNQ